jgi:hypothetical protein
MTTGKHNDSVANVDCLICTFGKSAIEEFRAFMAKHLATDFMIGDPRAAHDGYAHKLFPYDTNL